jgi:hypothetical protein
MICAFNFIMNNALPDLTVFHKICPKPSKIISFLFSAPLRSCSVARLSTSSDSSSGSLASLFVGNMDPADVFTIDDDQIQQLEEADTTVEMEPEFSPTVIKVFYV